MSVVNYYWLFFLLLFIVSFLYESVGHGGASGYLALMALFGFAVTLLITIIKLLKVGK